MDLLEDGQIVDLYLSRDETAIGRTSEKYGARLRALSLGITGDRMTAEECENDAYLEAWDRIPPKEPRDHFYPFLACIVRHLSIDRCREREALKRGGYLVELTDELEGILASPDDVEKEWDGKQLGEAISRYLASLPEEKRLIFVGRYFNLDSISAVAARLGITESKVKSVLFRVRKELKSYLAGEGYLL